MKALEVITATAPSAWASYLINGDNSGITREEQHRANQFVRHVCGGEYFPPVSCEDAGFVRMHDAYAVYPLASDCQTYTFLL